ncbi:hypothetical protein KCP75_14040 [Salmonella enterica subsp. enterica]|nr:hypothetical protein KCP75_14040 [Salmonella enterica subsp. enterica]
MTTPHVLFGVGHLPGMPTCLRMKARGPRYLERDHRYHPASGTHSVLAFPEGRLFLPLREGRADLLKHTSCLSGWPIKWIIAA